MRICIAVALILAGCVSGTYSRFDVEREPDAEVLAALQPGATLQECLVALGAPLVVREHGAGVVLAFAGRRDVGWNVTVDLPTGGQDAPFSYSRDRGGLRGAVLFFGSDWTLLRLQRGWLAEILPDAPARPQPVELIED